MTEETSAEAAPGIQARGLVKRYGAVTALQHPVLYTAAWSLVILAVFIPLANAHYRVSTSR